MDKLFYFILSITFLFIFLPIFYSLTNPGNLSYLFHAEVLEAFKVTILAGILATFISLLLSLPSAYILARKEFKFKKFVEGILDLPMAIPHVVVGIMLLSFIYGIDPLKELVGPYIADNFFGIVLVYLFVGLPFMLNSLKDGILAVDEELEHVSRTLGASKVKTFFTIIL
ncbi:ABC transporter permease subunit, partial [Methanocaldococcus infernus]